jgi:hypothetical protein
MNKRKRINASSTRLFTELSNSASTLLVDASPRYRGLVNLSIN